MPWIVQVTMKVVVLQSRRFENKYIVTKFRNDKSCINGIGTNWCDFNIKGVDCKSTTGMKFGWLILRLRDCDLKIIEVD